MAIILNIDTSGETASICLSDNAGSIGMAANEKIKDHASWLHPAIKQLLQEFSTPVSALEAIAISIGPGSYTGLRVGLSAAKGLCYALKIPLIAIGTLKIIASAVNKEEAALFCPLIDARRMEVFTALFDKKLIEIIKPSAMLINEYFFADFLAKHKVVFCGSGSYKLQTVLSHENAIFSTTKSSAVHMAPLATDCMQECKFADLAYTEPLYLKEFYLPLR